MDKYIDREALLQEISKQKAASKHSFPRLSFVVGDVLACIRTAPDADVAPVVHGEWVDTPNGIEIKCSYCKADWNVFENDTYRFIYCPNCGAKMEFGD